MCREKEGRERGRKKEEIETEKLFIYLGQRSAINKRSQTSNNRSDKILNLTHLNNYPLTVFFVGFCGKRKSNSNFNIYLSPSGIENLAHLELCHLHFT